MTPLNALDPSPSIVRIQAPVRPGVRLAEFMERRGRHVFEAAGCFWASIDLGSRYYTSLPDTHVLESGFGEIRSALWRHKGLAAQFATHGPGSPNGVFLLEDPTYSMDHVQKRMRNNIRKGLKSYEIRPVSKADLLEQAIPINLATMARHHTFRDEFSNSVLWGRNVEAIQSMPDTWCMGAYQGTTLCAYLFGIVDSGILYLMVQKCTDEALELQASPALLYETTLAAFASGNIRGISLGHLPFANSPHLHQFKLRMGYPLVSYNMRIKLNPLLQPLESKWALDLAQSFGPRIPNYGERIAHHARVLAMGRGIAVAEIPKPEIHSEPNPESVSVQESSDARS